MDPNKDFVPENLHVENAGRTWQYTQISQSVPTETRKESKLEPGKSAGLLDWRGMVRGWLEEGQKRVERVGKRYGILGYEKVDKKAQSANEGTANPFGIAHWSQEQRVLLNPRNVEGTALQWKLTI